MQNQLQGLEKQADQLLERILEASIPSVIRAYEDKIKKIEEEKLLIVEKIANCGKPLKPHDEILRTSLELLSNPHEIWAKGQLEDKRAVLKLAFLDKFAYRKGEGFRIPKISLPFNHLRDFCTQKS